VQKSGDELREAAHGEDEEKSLLFVAIGECKLNFRFGEFLRYFPETSYITCQYWMVSLYIYRHQSKEAMHSPSCSVSVHNFYRSSDLDIFKIILTQWVVSVATEMPVLDITHGLCPITSIEALRRYQLLSHYSCGKRSKPKALFSLCVCSMNAQRTLSVHSRLTHSHTKYSLLHFKCICPWPHSAAEMYDCALVGMRMSLLWKWAIGLWCAHYPYLVSTLRQHDLVPTHTAHQTSSSLNTFT
jgi:hypothetical protein